MPDRLDANPSSLEAEIKSIESYPFKYTIEESFVSPEMVSLKYFIKREIL